MGLHFISSRRPMADARMLLRIFWTNGMPVRHNIWNSFSPYMDSTTKKHWPINHVHAFYRGIRKHPIIITGKKVALWRTFWWYRIESEAILLNFFLLWFKLNHLSFYSCTFNSRSFVRESSWVTHQWNLYRLCIALDFVSMSSGFFAGSIYTSKLLTFCDSGFFSAYQHCSISDFSPFCAI